MELKIDHLRKDLERLRDVRIEDWKDQNKRVQVEEPDLFNATVKKMQENTAEDYAHDLVLSHVLKQEKNRLTKIHNKKIGSKMREFAKRIQKEQKKAKK